MAFLAHSQPAGRPERSLDSWLVIASVALLAGLALADRAAAWLIGEFPSSAMLWQLRFEFLRPIGVYYDFATISLGPLSLGAFAGVVMAMATLILAGALSRVRFLRAIAYHALCGLALLLWACSLEYREGIYTPAGGPSRLYALIGAALALAAAVSCLAIHAEYLGWGPAGSTLLRRGRIAWRRAQRRLDGAVLDLIGKLGTGSRPEQVALAPLHVPERRRFED
jgi:hypothetical protein